MARQAQRHKKSGILGPLMNPSRETITSWDKPEVLLVEDGTGVFEEIGSILQDQGFQVLLAPNAETAGEEVKNYQVDVVMVGATRQNLGGLRLLDLVKQLNPKIVTVVLTRGLGGDLPVEAYETDIDCYLGWPVLPGDLGRRLMNLLAGDLIEAGNHQTAKPKGVVDQRVWFLLGRFIYEVWSSLNQVSDSLSILHAQPDHAPRGKTGPELEDISRTITRMTDTVQQFIQETPWPELQFAEALEEDHFVSGLD